MKGSVPTVAIALACTIALSAQKPVRQGVVSVLYYTPPATLATFYADSNTILVVTVVEQNGLEDAFIPGRILTAVTGRIVVVVKANPQVGPIGDMITFRISGGEVDKGDYVERIVDTGQPKLLKDGTYL